MDSGHNNLGHEGAKLISKIPNRTVAELYLSNYQIIYTITVFLTAE